MTKIIKTGYFNIYAHRILGERIYRTKEEADLAAESQTMERIECRYIRWEEELKTSDLDEEGVENCTFYGNFVFSDPPDPNKQPKYNW